MAYFFTLKVVTRSSETLVDFQWTTQCYIPEDRTLQEQHTVIQFLDTESCQLVENIHSIHAVLRNVCVSRRTMIGWLGSYVNLECKRTRCYSIQCSPLS
jgi:hypothetical protein